MAPLALPVCHFFSSDEPIALPVVTAFERRHDNVAGYVFRAMVCLASIKGNSACWIGQVAVNALDNHSARIVRVGRHGPTLVCRPHFVARGAKVWRRGRQHGLIEQKHSYHAASHGKQQPKRGSPASSRYTMSPACLLRRWLAGCMISASCAYQALRSDFSISAINSVTSSSSGASLEGNRRLRSFPIANSPDLSTSARKSANELPNP